MRVFVAALAAGAFFAATAADIEQARKLHERTDYRGSLQVLAQIPGDAANPGQVQEWIGRNHFMLGDFKKAAEAFEKAVAAEPQNSNYYHWLGKAYGRRAESSSMFSAPGLASKARQQFEKAVDLDPKNLEAINDLFEYYLEAPGFLGGGLDKAASLSHKINAVDPVEYHYALAKIAEHRKDWNQAEQHFRRAMEMAPRQVGRAIDLAKFLAKQGKHQESEAALARAEKIAPDSPKVMFAKASYYIQAKKNLPVARELLQKYLQAPLKPEDPSREEAQRLLKQAGI